MYKETQIKKPTNQKVGRTNKKNNKKFGWFAGNMYFCSRLEK